MNSQFINKSVTPVLVWATKNPDEETREQVIANHERFRTLPLEAKYKLGFQHTPDIIKKIGEDFNLDPLKMASIARAVRGFYFGDLSKEKIEGFLMEEMEVSSEQAQKIASIVDQKIISVPIPKDVSEQTVEIPLLDALSKYQRLSEQTLTEDRIMVKGEGQPVRGSIRNWLRHYRDVMGIRKHSAMERGQMLFQGENTKRLGGAERERLALVFRSLDENIPLSIDSGRQEIIFPTFEEKASVLASLGSSEGSEKSLPSIGTSFRPVERFHTRTAPIKKALEWNGSQGAPEPSRSPESPGISVPVYGGVSTLPLGLGSPPSAASGLESQAAAPSPFSLGGKMSFSSQHKLPSERERVSQGGASDMRQVPQANPVSQASQRVGIIRPRGNRFEPRDVSLGISLSQDSGGSDSSPVVNLRGRRQ